MRLIRSAVAVAGISAAMLAAVAPAALAAPVTRSAASARAEVTPDAEVSPTPADPGETVTFSMICTADASTATLYGTTLGLDEQIPMDLGAHQGQFSATVTLPDDIAPGTYSPSIDCDNGQSAEAILTVNGLPAAGGAQTGDGTTSTATNGTLTVGGLAVLGIGAVAGGFALRRRRSGRNRA